MESQPDASDESRAGRQRRPAAIIPIVPPGHPRRSPHPIWPPAPAQRRVLEPTPIMKWRPAPRIIRHPIPPAIGIYPTPAVEIRPPTMIADDNRWLPATAATFDVHPVPVRCQGIVVVAIIGRSGFRFWRRPIVVRGVSRHRRSFDRKIWSGRRLVKRHIWRITGWWGEGRLRFRRGHSDLGRRSLKQMIPLDHRSDHRGGHAYIVQINDFLSPQVERAERVRDKRKHHALLNSCIGELDDFGGCGGWFQIRRNLDFSRNLFSWRISQALVIGCRKGFLRVRICRGFGNRIGCCRRLLRRRLCGRGYGFARRK